MDQKERTEKLAKTLKESKILNNDDLICFDYLYNIRACVKMNLDIYRRGECELEEALIKIILEQAKKEEGMGKQFDELLKNYHEKEKENEQSN